MSVDLKCTTGTINYTDFLHVTAAKVISPGTVVWETWIPVPITNYNFIIPGLDPENYIISYYDAPTNVAVGALRLQLIANALTNEFIYEKRFYKCGRGQVGDPAPGDDMIIDPYFTGKTVVAGFREAFRFLMDAVEWQMITTSTTLDTFKMLDGVKFNLDEVFCIDIKLAAGVLASTGGSLYNGRVDVVDPVYAVAAGDKGKRHRLVGTITTQLLNLPSLAALAQDNAFLFDNGCGGVSRQVRVLCDGTDVVKTTMFKNGDVVITTLTEIWVDRGDVLMIAKVGDNWELILPYIGKNVGEHFMGVFKDHPNTVIQDGQIGLVALDGDELPKLWWWLNNRVPANHKVQDATVNSPAYVHPAGKEGMWVVDTDPASKKFRTGNWQGMTDKGLKNFKVYGGDVNRTYDFPGGKQDQKLLNHRHLASVSISSTNNPGLHNNDSIMAQNETGGIGDFKYTLAGHPNEPDVGRTGFPRTAAGALIGSEQNQVDNIGCVALVRI